MVWRDVVPSAEVRLPEFRQRSVKRVSMTTFVIQLMPFLDSGATHVLLPGHMLPKGARSFEVTVNLAVGKEKAKCWRMKSMHKKGPTLYFHWVD